MDNARITYPKNYHPTKGEIDIMTLGFILGNDHRLNIIYYLAHNERPYIGEVTRFLGIASQDTYHHLDILRDHGIVSMEKDGHHNYVILKRDGIYDRLRSFLEEDGAEDLLGLRRDKKKHRIKASRR